MHELNDSEVEMCAGGMKWKGNRQSENVIDERGFFTTNYSTGGIMWGATFKRYFF
jgi:hypothetical protein